MNWLRWQRGRQEGGYDKLMLVSFWFFDCYILRFPEGSEIKLHRDPVPGKRHYRANIIVKRSSQGGKFIVFHNESGPFIYTERFNFFRSDLCSHAVTKVEGGSRYVLSFGWAIK